MDIVKNYRPKNLEVKTTERETFRADEHICILKQNNKQLKIKYDNQLPVSL